MTKTPITRERHHPFCQTSFPSLIRVTAWPPPTRTTAEQLLRVEEDFARRIRFCEKKISRERNFSRRRKKISREEDFARKKFREKEILWEDPEDWNRLNDDSIQSSYQSNAIQGIELFSKEVVLAFSLVHQLIFWVSACVRAHNISLCRSTHTVMKKDLAPFL